MKIEQLEQFIKIQECGSISKAARKLYISQPSLTKSIAQLEMEYGIKLFTRTPKGIELTEEGNSFLFYAKQILTAADGLNHAFQQNLPKYSRLFVASQEFDFMPDLLNEMYKNNEHNLTHYNILEADRGEVISHVLNRHSDIGIFVCYGEDEKKQLWMRNAAHLDLHTLAVGDVLICVGPHSDYYNREQLTIPESRAVLNICLDMEVQAKENLYFELNNHGFNTEQIMFFNSVYLCQEMLLKTNSLMYVSPWTKKCLTDPSLRFIPVESQKNNLLICCTRQGEPLNEASLQFLENLFHLFGQDEQFQKYLKICARNNSAE